MTEPRPLTAIVCDFDTWTRRALGTAVIEAGFDVVAEGANVLDVLREVGYLQPSLVVLTQDSLAMNPLDILREVRGDTGGGAGDKAPEVVLVTHDVSVRERAVALGAYDVALHGDADQLLEVLADVRVLLETGERRKQSDRRTGRERRAKQDWSKVTAQRRSGAERRRVVRRASDERA